MGRIVFYKGSTGSAAERRQGMEAAGHELRALLQPVTGAGFKAAIVRTLRKFINSSQYNVIYETGTSSGDSSYKMSLIGSGSDQARGLYLLTRVVPDDFNTPHVPNEIAYLKLDIERDSRIGNTFEMNITMPARAGHDADEADSDVFGYLSTVLQDLDPSIVTDENMDYLAGSLTFNRCR